MSMIQFPVIDPVATGANIWVNSEGSRPDSPREISSTISDLRSRKPSTINGNGARAFPV